MIRKKPNRPNPSTPSVQKFLSNYEKLSEKEIKSEFRKLALILHPNKTQNKNPRTKNIPFQELQNAYNYLINPKSGVIYRIYEYYNIHGNPIDKLNTQKNYNYSVTTEGGITTIKYTERPSIYSQLQTNIRNRYSNKPPPNKPPPNKPPNKPQSRSSKGRWSRKQRYGQTMWDERGVLHAVTKI